MNIDSGFKCEEAVRCTVGCWHLSPFYCMYLTDVVTVFTFHANLKLLFLFDSRTNVLRKTSG